MFLHLNFVLTFHFSWAATEVFQSSMIMYYVDLEMNGMSHTGG